MSLDRRGRPDLDRGDRAGGRAKAVGHGLLISGTNRTAFESISSQTEHLLATTKPSDLVDLIGLDEGGEDEL